jgi:hypothetical protein
MPRREARFLLDRDGCALIMIFVRPNHSLPPLSAQRSIALNTLRFVPNLAVAITRHRA